MSSSETRCGFVAVLGAPNSGKSTLVNTAVGQKVSIVTQKVQTTRMAVRGMGRDFSWDRQVQEYVDVYRRLIG